MTFRMSMSVVIGRNESQNKSFPKNKFVVLSKLNIALEFEFEEATRQNSVFFFFFFFFFYCCCCCCFFV